MHRVACVADLLFQLRPSESEFTTSTDIFRSVLCGNFDKTTIKSSLLSITGPTTGHSSTGQSEGLTGSEAQS